MDLELRVVGLRAPALEDGRAQGARRHPRPRGALEGGDAAGVIEMGVRVQDQAHVRDVEAERADVLEDQRGRVGQAAVDEHVAVRRRDEDRRQAARPDVPGIAEDPEGLLRGIPLRTAGALLRGIRGRQRIERRGTGGQGQEREGELGGGSGWAHAPDDTAVRSRREAGDASAAARPHCPGAGNEGGTILA